MGRLSFICFSTLLAAGPRHSLFAFAKPTPLWRVQSCMGGHREAWGGSWPGVDPRTIDDDGGGVERGNGVRKVHTLRGGLRKSKKRYLPKNPPQNPPLPPYCIPYNPVQILPQENRPCWFVLRCLFGPYPVCVYCRASLPCRDSVEWFARALPARTHAPAHSHARTHRCVFGPGA